ncbi:sodium:solute symporter family transporter [Mucilaginibacter boryungensis]|uniref:Sodium/solute symporter n=1 Tax=Mucilaginibacter boryungensis TaxID=768480 RepID=A0ABR9XIE3_9SPHI|nr:sodium/solute symporter [Mucilaginibacter boryungensis]MBE9667158.1 sodium/solute symporter [Mucilaginibacter boryungensis]
MKRYFLKLLIGLIAVIFNTNVLGQSFLKWDKLPPIPDPVGFAGSFAGVSNGVLVVAGGSNFPNGGKPWTGASKVYTDKVFVLDKPNGKWKEAGKLPRPLGYGVSITWNGNLICLGGSNSKDNYADAFILKYINGQIQLDKLPPLPGAIANSAGVVIGNVVYMAGGIKDPGSTATERIFWSLDLSSKANTWKVLPSWSGPSRMLSVAGTQEGNFYLFSGVELIDGKRKYLSDAYCYSAIHGWKKIASVPESVAAAPSPANSSGQTHLLIFGGDNGLLAPKMGALKDAHPGFSTKIWDYNIVTDTWSVLGKIPSFPKENNHINLWAPVTTAAVTWSGSTVFPGGEVRPATRTPNVLIVSPVQPAGAFKLLDWTVVGIYFLLVIAISVVVSRNMKNTTSEFFLGGNKIPWWAAGLSIFGSKLSALTFIAIPAKAYATDWIYLLSNLMIVAVAPVIIYFYLPYFRKLKITSVYEYLGIRFNAKVKFLGSLNFVIFQISRLGIVIYLPALVLSTVTGVDIWLCIIGTSIITTAYSISGGIEAVIWTEVMQVGVLLGGALLTLVFIAHSVDGGMTQIIKEAATHNKLRVGILSWNHMEPVLWVVFIGGFLTQLVTYSSDQVVVQRYLTTATEKEARRSIYTNAILVIPASLIFFSVGTALWVYYRHNPTMLNPHGRTDDVFPWFISHQLPAGLSGLVIAGLFAATMSTIGSSMNSIATVITTDFYKPYKSNSTDKECFAFARKATLVLGVLGCMIAIYLVTRQDASIFDQYLKIIGLFGGCLAGMFVAGIFFPKINGNGILIGFIVSSAALYFIQAANVMNFFLYPVLAILLCVATGYLFSVLLPEKKSDQSN